MNIMVLDVGTTSMRGILYDENGNKLFTHQLPNHPVFASNGWVNEAARDWHDNTYAIVKYIVEAAKGKTIDAISITSQRSSILPVDSKGEPLMDTIMWQDIRNLSICKELEAYNDQVFYKTGSRVNSVFSGSKMTWVRRECPELYQKVYKFLNIPEYINYLMTGKFVSDYTYASRTGLMNLRKKCFDDELLKLYEVEKDKLCHLEEPGSTVGYTTEEFKKRTGLPSGTPVIHAGGDQQCAAVGQGVICAGDISIVAGTGGFIIAALDAVPENLTSNVICNCSAIAGKYVIEANVLACSAAFDWFVHELYGMEQIDYQYTEKELSSTKDATDCLVIPYFKGRGAPDWNSAAKAIFADVTLATRKNELFKSMMESIFMELKNHIINFSEYVDLHRIYISGGLTKSRTLNQLQSDIYGKEIYSREDKEATAFGAYLIAMVNQGCYKNLEDARSMLNNSKDEEIYKPNMEIHSLYEKKRMRMNVIYNKLYS